MIPLPRRDEGPFHLLPRLPRTEGDSVCAISERTRFLWCANVNIFLPDDLKIDKSDLANQLLQVCFQQSTGNSPCPEIDIHLRFRRHLFTYHDIGDLKTSTRPEYTQHFLKNFGLAWYQVEHAVRDHDVDRAIGW